MSQSAPSAAGRAARDEVEPAVPTSAAPRRGHRAARASPPRRPLPVPAAARRTVRPRTRRRRRGPAGRRGSRDTRRLLREQGDHGIDLVHGRHGERRHRGHRSVMAPTRTLTGDAPSRARSRARAPASSAPLRTSCSRLPRPRPISTLASPCVKYTRSGTSVMRCSCCWPTRRSICRRCSRASAAGWGDAGACRPARTVDVHALEPHLAVAHARVGLGERGPPLQRLHLVAGEHDAALEGLEDAVVVASLPVRGDDPLVRVPGRRRHRRAGSDVEEPAHADRAGDHRDDHGRDEDPRGDREHVGVADQREELQLAAEPIDEEDLDRRRAPRSPRWRRSRLRRDLRSGTAPGCLFVAPEDDA